MRRVKEMRGETPLLEGLDRRVLTRDLLVGLRTRALRRRVWFRVLSCIERGLVDLTIRWVERVQSGRLAKVLVGILEKLVQALESRLVRAALRGRELAERLSELAVGWGDTEAYRWRFDLGFQRCLGVGVLFG